MATTHKINRRGFLSSLGLMSGGLLLSCDSVSGIVEILKDEPLTVNELNLFVQIQSDGFVNVVVCRSEMGQGIRTGLTAIIADELGAAWDKINVLQADGDKVYGNQNTDGSRSIRTRMNDMQQMGATARTILIEAAAKKWQVSPGGLTTEDSFVKDTNGKKIAFAKLVEESKTIPTPSDIKLRDKSEFKYIGKGLKTVDIKDYVRGRVKFGIDVRLPDMKFAAIARCPVTYGEVKSYDDKDALKVGGVHRVFKLDRVPTPMGALGGVVVVANNTWAAFKAKDALQIEWKNLENAVYNSDTYQEEILANIKKEGKAKRKEGDLNKAFSTANKTFERIYTTPHLVHAPMEVPNATAHFKEDGTCELWVPSQNPQGARKEVAEALGIDEEQVTIHVTFLGGGFGRKAKHDFAVEAALVSKELGGPVQVVWTREDDIKHSYYHTTSAQSYKVSLDANNNITGWLHRTAFPSIKSTFVQGATDAGNWEIHQATLMKYEIDNYQVQDCEAPSHLRIGWMRSVNCIQHSFTQNIFFDELAESLGKDPAEYRMEMIGSDRVYEDKNKKYQFDTKRYKAVLTEVKKLSGWGQELPEDSALGLAMEYSFFSYTAVVAQVSLKEGKVKVDKVFMAFDCGTCINPDIVTNQLEGSAVFGTSIALFSKITVKDGAIEQSNFNDYVLTRMKDAPEVAVTIMDIDAAPAGVGEPGVPPVAPAIFNAVASLTGQRFNSFPLSEHGLV